MLYITCQIWKTFHHTLCDKILFVSKGAPCISCTEDSRTGDNRLDTVSLGEGQDHLSQSSLLRRKCKLILFFKFPHFTNTALEIRTAISPSSLKY